MDFAEATALAIERTKHQHLARLVDPADPAYDEAYIPVVWALAEGRLPEPNAAPGETGARCGGCGKAGSPAETPGLLRMARSALSAAADFAMGGFAVVDDQTFHQRIAICQQCPHQPSARCPVCGCWIAAKARLPHEQCPEGRW